MKVIFAALLFLNLVGCDSDALQSEVRVETEPIVGIWGHEEEVIFRFRQDGSIMRANDRNGEIGRWRRLEGLLWKFTISDETLEAVNSRQMFPPLMPTYTLSDTEPDFNEFGTWALVPSGGCYETALAEGDWGEGLKYTVDEDTLIELQGDYSNHYLRISE